MTESTQFYRKKIHLENDRSISAEKRKKNEIIHKMEFDLVDAASSGAYAFGRNK